MRDLSNSEIEAVVGGQPIVDLNPVAETPAE